MVQKSESNEVCTFCGKERTVRKFHDDGMDYEGHARGHVGNWTEDNGCDCPLGRIAKERQQIKRMCLNCAYNVGGCCTNKKELEEISNMFDVGKSVRIKNKTRCCINWAINKDILFEIVSQ